MRFMQYFKGSKGNLTELKPQKMEMLVPEQGIPFEILAPPRKSLFNKEGVVYTFVEVGLPKVLLLLLDKTQKPNS